MTIRIEKGKSVFELNPGLGVLFPKLDNSEMEFVAFVADTHSILRMKPEAERRKIAVKLVPGLMEKGKPNALGKTLIDGKSKKVEAAIQTYHKEINNNKRGKVMKTLEALGKYYDEQLEFMRSDAPDDFDEKVKWQAATARAIKDETLKDLNEQIKYFEKELANEYEAPDSVIEDLTEEQTVIGTNTADWIDVAGL